MTQKEAILDYLRHNKLISPMIAFSELGITKLATRIGEIERDGIQIYKAMRTGKNRYGKLTHYMIYSLRVITDEDRVE